MRDTRFSPDRHNSNSDDNAKWRLQGRCALVCRCAQSGRDGVEDVGMDTLSVARAASLQGSMKVSVKESSFPNTPDLEPNDNQTTIF